MCNLTLMCVAGRSLMVKKADGIKESTDSSNTIEDDGKSRTHDFFNKNPAPDTISLPLIQYPCP